MFLSLSAVIGKTEREVCDCLANYAQKERGIFQKDNGTNKEREICAIEEHNGNTAIVYPDDFLEWDDCSAHLSKELQATVFSCHIHDGSLWMYILYYAGEIVDQFNPIPDYWEDISAKEMKAWAGNAATVVKYVPGLSIADIDEYLVQWDLDGEDSGKAYLDDEYEKPDWQLFDFLRKIGIPVLLSDDDGKPVGNTYTFRIPEKSTGTNELELRSTAILHDNNAKKPWWKIW